MGFMQSYKRLDNLCKQIYPDENNGVSGYLREMEKKSSESIHVEGWNADYKNLKHYRWMRNKIAHEEDVTEQNICAPGDKEWVDEFYARMMNQTDPLSVLRKYKESRKIHHNKPAAPAQKRTSAQANKTGNKKKSSSAPKRRNSENRSSTGSIASVIVLLSVFILVIVYVFVKLLI